MGAARTSTVKPSIRRVGLIVFAGAVVAAIWWPLRYSLPGPLAATTLPAPRQEPPVSAVARADFVGAETCASCHAAEHARWEKSTHGRAGGAPSADLVIAPFNGRPIRFRDAVVTPRVEQGRWEFVVARDDAPVEIVRVDGVIGRGHMEGGGTQGFVTRRPDGTVRFVPFDWSRHSNTWFCNTNSRTERGWVPITEAMRITECGDWPPARVMGDLPRWANCQGCHGSQVAVEDSAGVRSTRWTSLAINCESCHGPGRRHVQLAESGEMARNADIGFAVLRTLDKDASNRVCLQCHSVKDQLREGYLPGDSLELFYSLRLPTLGDRPLHPDGRVRTFAYQEAQSFSECYVNGGMTCSACHDPHSQSYRTISELPIPGRTDDRQCTSCHPSKAADLPAHTRHAAASPGSRCTACHAPYLQQPETMDRRTGGAGRAPIRYARSDHAFPIPRPRADSALGVRTACAGCHAERSTAQLETQVAALWGELKPPLVATPNDKARTFTAMAAAFEAAGGPDSRPVSTEELTTLRVQSRDADVDIRAMALATLHLRNGSSAHVRRDLARAAAREGARDFALRSRWATILGFAGDQLAESGNFASAVAAYDRALAVAPNHPRLLQSRGNAARALGDAVRAIASYEAALARDPRNALTLVNLGIALQLAGDSARGAEAFRRAAELDPAEPLAWFNLGNATVQRGDLRGASAQFRRALAIDGSLVEAHFQLARIALLGNDARGALAELRQGLALDSSNVAARDLARQLSRSLQR